MLLPDTLSSSIPGNMTGMVGTALYVSPEVQGNTKATYNQVRFQFFEYASLDIYRVIWQVLNLVHLTNFV